MRRSMLPLLIATLVSLSAAAAAKPGDEPRAHTVWTGQRLASIAKRYNVTVDAICRANDINRRDPIHKGQKLIIPARDDEDGSEARKLRLEGFLEDDGKKSKKEEERPTKGADRTKPSKREASSSRAPEKPRVHTVWTGQRLASIAKRYNVTIDAICHANGIDRRAPIHAGQKLVIPSPGDEDGSYARSLRVRGFVGRVERKKEEKRAKRSRTKARRGGSPWARYSKAPWRRGYVTLQGYSESWKGYVIGPGSKVLPKARLEISRVLNATGKRPKIHPRLVRLIAKVSDQFGGRPLRIVSGYRTESYSSHSRHKVGRAVDFAIAGVPNSVLRDYLKTFHAVGVGYYPNSSFVHLDVRSESTYWIDYSGPGEAPQYGKPGGGGSAESGSPGKSAGNAKSSGDE